MHRRRCEGGFRMPITRRPTRRPGKHYNQLKRSFTTTNMIESVMSMIGQKTDKVDYWMNSSQKQRWVATALLYSENRLNKVCGYKYLSRLKVAMQKEIGLLEAAKKATATVAA